MSISPNSETYTPGHSTMALALMSRRRATTHAAFFTPHLRLGMKLLDCGCGPASMTMDLARLVAPGETTGIDREDSQFGAARALAVAEKIPLTLQSASVYELPFADGSFDAVFSHALFEHIAEPLQALKEIRRVLKPGGFVGLRAPDWGGFLIYPEFEDACVAIRKYEEIQTGNGGETHRGRQLASLLRQAGFEKIIPTATYEIYPEASIIGEFLAVQLDRRNEGVHAAALRKWMHDPDALFAQSWGEAVGWTA